MLELCLSFVLKNKNIDFVVVGVENLEQLKDVKNFSVEIAIRSLEKIIKNSIDKKKLDKIYVSSIDEAKKILKNKSI